LQIRRGVPIGPLASRLHVLLVRDSFTKAMYRYDSAKGACERLGGLEI
jgi:hypothetical protein